MRLGILAYTKGVSTANVRSALAQLDDKGRRRAPVSKSTGVREWDLIYMPFENMAHKHEQTVKDARLVSYMLMEEYNAN